MRLDEYLDNDKPEIVSVDLAIGHDRITGKNYIKQWWDPKSGRIITEIKDYAPKGTYNAWNLPTGLYTTDTEGLVPLIEGFARHDEILAPDYDKYMFHAVATGQLTGRFKDDENETR